MRWRPRRDRYVLFTARVAADVLTDAGLFFRLGSRFNIGFDVRYSTADVDLDFGFGLVAPDVNAGGLSYRNAARVRLVRTPGG